MTNSSFTQQATLEIAIQKGFEEALDFEEALRIVEGFGIEEKSKIVIMTPEMAGKLLERNFDRNRKMSKEKVKGYIKKIKGGKFYLGDSCICIDKNGRIINGQHRLDAIRQAGIPVKIGVIWNMPSENAAIMDIGKKRTAAEAMRIQGFDFSQKNLDAEFACVRNALTPYEAAAVGTQYYVDIDDLEMCAEYFEYHKDFIVHICSQYRRVSSFMKTTALRMYAEMANREKEATDGNIYVHGQDAWTRSKLWLELISKGSAEEFRHKYDNCAILLRDYETKVKLGGRNFTSKDDARKCLTMGWKFMVGEGAASMGSIFKKDRFKSLYDLEPTTIKSLF